MTSAIEDAVRQGMVKALPLTYGYYRQPNGWITVSPVTALEELKYRREGWEPLPQYGRVQMANAYMAEHPLEFLFMNGGAVELSRDQIIKMALHLNPPVVPSCRTPLNDAHKSHSATCWQPPITITFPQLGDDVPEGLQCRFCQRPPFPTEEARSQHEGVMHGEEKGRIRTGETLAESLIEGLKGAGAIVGANTAVARLPYVCGVCDADFDNLTVFGKHVKEHREPAD